MEQGTQRIVITGSTRGIGKGMAREFLARGHKVMISGRSQRSVDSALADLGGAGEKLAGAPCEVSKLDEVQALWDAAEAALGGVDVWINNAGIANRRALIGELDPEEIRSVSETNVLGTMYGSKVALAGMTKQGHGFVYNFEGLGSDGRTMPGLSLYGASKYAITYFTKCLIKEAKSSPVKVGYLSPGIVLTHLSMGDAEHMDPERVAYMKKMFNILADRVETVTPWLVEGVLSNAKHGARIAWLTPRKAAWRFLKSPFSKRDLFKEFELERKLEANTS